MTIPNIPRSPDEPLQPFPEEPAQKVLEYGRKIGEEAVERIINLIRDIFGHPEKVVPLADDWGHHVKGELIHSTDSILTAKSNLISCWEGTSYESFKIYTDHIEKVCMNAAQVVSDQSDLLQSAARTMSNVYNSLIQFLTSCAATLIELTGGLIGSIRDWFGGAEVVANAIAEFVRSCSQLLRDFMASIQNYRETAQDLRQKAVEFRIPEAIPTSSIDIDGWDVRKRA